MAATRKVAGLLGGLLAAAGGARGADLPEDRAETLYHSYSGGGVSANGPAVLVRKSMTSNLSVMASYYADIVSNASIDVVTTASRYHEKRIERSVGLDYVYRDVLVSLKADKSEEPDYTAERSGIDVTEELNGGNTTIWVGYTRGNDTVGRHGSPNFSATANHWQYRLGESQVLSPVWVMSVSFEADSDGGYLASPYRSARVLGALVPETAPSTRSSRALALRSSYSLDALTAIRAEFRMYNDSWDVRAGSVEAGLARHLGPDWLVEGYARRYAQQHALFYSDNFSSVLTYMSRNRQLSTFHSLGAGLKAGATVARAPGRYEVQVHAGYEWLRYDYQDFTDLRTGQPYSFDASVFELYATATF